MKSIARLMVVSCLFTVVSCNHPGQRLLTIQIEQDGQVVCEGMRGVSDSLPVSEMWDLLPEVSFSAESSTPSLETLNGDIVVRIRHVDHELSRARLKSLTLRPHANNSTWSIGHEETARVKRAVEF